MQPSKLTSFLKSLSSPAGWKAAGIGGAAAFIGAQLSGMVLAPFFDFSLTARPSLGELLGGQSLSFGFIGTALSLAVLAWNNHTSLRGRWYRDLWPGAALFLVIAMLSGGLGQILYSLIQVTRAVPWLFAGAGIGAAIGALRRDKEQALRGALGGALGGLMGGVTVDILLMISYTDSFFTLGSQLGVIITGAMIALFMHAVQQAMQSAWLMGSSTGPYEGREYPLSSEQTTVGQTELNDIALYRDRTVPARAGTIFFQNGQWLWRSEKTQTPALIDGQVVTTAVLQPGSRIQLGNTQFVFLTRETPAATNAVQPATPPPDLPRPTPGLQRGWQLWQPTTPLVMGGEGDWTVGRDAENALVIEDWAVSSKHACLRIRNNVLAIVDIGSTNGTFVNGNRLIPKIPVQLQDGDRLTLGQTDYIVRPI